jgi:peroxiredoxin
LLIGAIGCANGTGNATEQTSKQESISSKEIVEIGDIRGPMKITGTFSNAKSLDGRQITLYETEGKDRFALDSAIIQNGNFGFELEDVAIGLYRLGISKVEKTQGDIILNPEEAEIAISYPTANLLSGMTYSNSLENTAWTDYKKEKSKFDRDIKKINKSSVTIDVKREQIYARRKQFDQAQDNLADQHPRTFFAKMVRRLQSPMVMDRDHYWDDIDFKDESLIRSQVLNDRIMVFMQIHAREENLKSSGKQGFYNCVDRIADIVKERGSDRVLEFILYTMSESFYKSGSPEVSHYVIDNYFYGDDCGDSEISDLFKMKAAGLRNLEVGNTPPDFSLPDVNGKNIRFSEVVKENEYTLLLFWASFCHKCKEEIPMMKKFYPSASKKGFEILGVSIDYSRGSWIEGIKENDLPWLNVSDLSSWGGPVLKKFRVTKTPVMFLIDKNGTLVARPESAAEIEAFLKKNLK